MNTILSVVLLAAILLMAWFFRTIAEKFMAVFGETDSTTDQNKWHGNRVRAAGRR